MQGQQARQGGSYPQHSIVFQLVKKLQYGRAIYLCGNLQQLGNWNPNSALRLTWHQGDKWQAELPLPTQQLSHLVAFQFKFMISDYQPHPHSQIQWQSGALNRRINIQSIFQGSNLYYAEWGMQNYIFFLKTQDYEEREMYYMQGSVEALGGWREKRAMKRLGSEKGNPFFNYWKNNPEFAEQSSFSRIFMLSFSVSRDITSFNYIYISFGSSLQSQTAPGRAYNLNGCGPTKDRIMQFDWQGSKVVIDESTFDQMILQRFTNQIYLASQVQNIKQLQKISEKRVTMLVNVMEKEEEYKVSCFNLKNLCRQRNLGLESWTVGDVQGGGFVEQVKAVVEEVDQLVIKGHRVCLMLSNKVMRMVPISMLCLILFSGCSFGQALEITSRREKPPESQCKNTREIYNFISEKRMRGRSQVEKK